MIDNHMQVIDKRTRPFTIIDNEVLNVNGDLLPKLVTGKQLLVYAIICSKANNTNYIPSMNYIAKKLKIHRNSLAKALKDLEKNKLIKVQHRKGFKSRIAILDIPEKQKEIKLTNDTILDFIQAHYHMLTSESKELILHYLSTPSMDLPAKLKPLKKQLTRDKYKLKLVAN